jgi:hypothetical protein
VLWLTPVILTTQEAEIGKMEVPGQLEVSKTAVSTNKPGMVVHICHRRYMGGIRRRIEV